MIDITQLHSFGLPACARDVVFLRSLKDVAGLSQDTSARYLLGEGTNTVFVSDFEGQVVQVALKGIEVEEQAQHYRVTVAAGENWHQLILWLQQQQIFGLENLALIPGTVGAAPVQNIGAYGAELKDFCTAVHCLDIASGERQRWSPSECQFGYRSSQFKTQADPNRLIVAVELCLPKSWRANRQYGELAQLPESVSPETLMAKVIEIRQQKLPDHKQLGNAGSFFKNPIISQTQYQELQLQWPSIPGFPLPSGDVKVPAAWLIDTLGYKGKTAAGIQCHQHQPLVLLNTGNGTGEGLLQMAREIKQQVASHFAIEIENEVRLLGTSGLVHL